jgi:hypothetical protein
VPPLVRQYVFIVRHHTEYVCARVSALCGQHAVGIVLVLLQKASCGRGELLSELCKCA